MSDSKRARAFHWHDLPIETRRRIAHRGAGDCRPSNTPFADIFPCTGCTCWLGNAFRIARAEYHRAIRTENRGKVHNHTESEASADTPQHLWASGPDGTRPVSEVGDHLLAALCRAHPERAPLQEETEDVA
jgi:hypothetical protein